MVDHLCQFMNIEPFLHLWDRVCIIIVDHLLYVVLDLDCKYFTEYFLNSIFISDIGLQCFFFGLHLISVSG